MKIEKGKEYRCINDVEMDGSGKIEFKLGRTYKCSFDNNLIDESGDDHEIGDEIASKHFELLSDYYLRIHKGREIKGFRFNDFRGTNYEYTGEMNNYFGKKGKIECLNSSGKSFGVRFEDGARWFYPVDKCIDQLEKKIKIESFPLLPKDQINPDHYKSYSVECIDMMVAIYGKEKVAIHCELTAFKYRMRAGKKDDLKTDLEKEKWYLSKAMELRNDTHMTNL